MESTFSQPTYLEDDTHLPHLPNFTTTSDTFAQQAYHDVLKGQDVHRFLRDLEEYDVTQQRWSLPASPEGLLDAIYNVVRSVIGQFVRSETPGVERNVLSTQNTPGCGEKNEDGYRASPLLVVRAAGPSFEIPALEGDTSPPEEPPYAIGFTNMASYLIPRTQHELGSDEDILREMASYARYIFGAQPNRFFVRSAVISEEHARLVHIDRAGAQITPPIDIHTSPEILIQILAGLSSTNERLIGIDDSVQWTIDAGRKAQGTLTATGPSGKPVVYRVLETLPVPRGSVLGRGTTCWKVQDPDSLEEYVVKDSWRPDMLVPEHELLKLVEGVPGVVQMVSYEAGRGEVSDFRCPTTFGQYHNRIASRTVTKAYGKPILCFTSTLELLYALRDAIAGHQRLCQDDIRILHRDVSYGNVLLGRKGAPVGERGVLIDLDLAFRATDAEPTVRASHNIGTRPFQSISVLQSAYLKEKALVHDHVDELESFFYLLCYILLLFKPDGTRVPSDGAGPVMAYSWGVQNPEEAEHNKIQSRGFGQSLRIGKIIQASWGPTCASLFQNFRRWAITKSEEKSRLFDHGGALESALKNGAGPWQVFRSYRNEHYGAVLQMFDEAIDEIKASDQTILESIPTLPGVRAVDEPRTPAPPRLSITSVARSTIPAAPPTSPRTAQPPPPNVITGMRPVCPVPPPAPLPAVLAPPRRSTRIQEVYSRRNLVARGDAPRLVKPQPPVPSPLPGMQPRRSARIQKRRLEEEEQSSAPQRKVQRRINAPRRSTRSR